MKTWLYSLLSPISLTFPWWEILNKYKNRCRSLERAVTEPTLSPKEGHTCGLVSLSLHPCLFPISRRH